MSWRRDFDAARDPYTARNALGILPASAGGNVSNSGTPVAGQIAQWTDATHIQGIAAPSLPPQGRLTLQTATPVMTTTQAAKTTIFYSPYQGNLVPIYNGTSFVMMAFSELSALTTDTTKSPAAVGASQVLDWFIWSDAGTLRVGHGPAWTSDATRSAGTALVMVNGILLNNASITNGPAAQRGTYVGTTRSNGSSQLDWIYGGIAAGGTAAWFGVWNCYNRADVRTMVGDTAVQWAATGSVRASNGSNNMRVSAVFGLQEDAVSAMFQGVANCAAGQNAWCAVGFNGAGGASGSWVTQQANLWLASIGRFDVSPFGFNFWQAIEYSNSVSSAFGGQNLPVWQNGLFFNARM